MSLLGTSSTGITTFPQNKYRHKTEQDALISAWQVADARPKSNTEFGTMIQEERHPVLKCTRPQWFIETIAFIVFLFLY